MEKETTITFRVDSATKEEFMRCVAMTDAKAAYHLRKAMIQFIAHMQAREAESQPQGKKHARKG